MARKKLVRMSGDRVSHQDHLDRLKRCRLVLGGLDCDGNKVHPGMFDAGVLSLAHGDGTRRPPAEAIAAGVAALLDPTSCALDDYLFLQSFGPLEADVARVFRNGGIPPDAANNVCVECGTTRLFGAFLHCAARPGDVFLAAPTFYHSLPDWCARFGVILSCVSTRPEDGYKLTPEAIEEWLSLYVETGLMPKPKGLFLFNPTQTGALYRSEELERLAAFITKTDLLVLADHVFSDTEFPGVERAGYLAAQPGMANRVVTVDGVSKSHNLANIRIGWACGPKHIIEAMRGYSVSTIISVPRLNMMIAHAALSVHSDYLEENAGECSRRASIIANAVERWNKTIAELPGTRPEPESRFNLVHQPEAGHSLLLRCAPMNGLRFAHGVIQDSVDVARFFLSEAGVAVSPGYSSGLDGCEIRICFGSVGLSETYKYSAALEKQAASRAMGADTPFTNQFDNPQDTQLAGSPQKAPDNADRFKSGRDSICKALLSRMLPALVRLFEANAAPAAKRQAAHKKQGAA